MNIIIATLLVFMLCLSFLMFYFARKKSDIAKWVTAHEEVHKHAEKLDDDAGQFEELVKRFHGVFWIFDIPNNKVHFVSPQFEEIWGHKPTELYEHPYLWQEPIIEEDRRGVEQAFSAALTTDGEANGMYRSEYRIRTKSGDIKWIEDSGAAVYDHDGKPIRLVGSAIDITQRKRYEETIKTHLAQKTKTNHQLAATHAVLADTIKCLSDTNKELEDFSYIASHDLKEPLRGISLYTNLLLADDENQLSSISSQRLKKLPKLVVQMENLLDALLECSRVQSSDTTLETVDLNKVLNNAKRMLAARLKDEKVNVTAEDLPIILSESNAIQQVFTNLISNAIKYNTAENKLVEIGVSKREESGVTLFFKDNGIGIAEENRESIFKLFNRLHGKNKYGGGIGAGLTITKKIVDRSMGRLWVESKLGEGSTFFVFLPTTDLTINDDAA